MKLFFLVFFITCQMALSSATSLKVGFYRSTCLLAEKIVQRTVTKVVARDHGLAASLIRMHFHDCFVRGCDASVLLDSTPGNRSEKLSLANNPSLRGYEVIHDAKVAIEAHCPDTVSCANIIAFAARDSTFLTAGKVYSVPAGRRDGKVSIESEVLQNLPFPSFTTDQLITSFAKKGLSTNDMVTLSGAHSIGVSHCSSFSARLFNFNSTHSQDPSINLNFAKFLKSRCPPPSLNAAKSTVDATVPLDVVAPNHLDANYYNNLIKGKGLLTSDQALAGNPFTAMLVAGHANNPSNWKNEFVAAMVRMGFVDVLTGMQGEVRRNCRVVN